MTGVNEWPGNVEPGGVPYDSPRQVAFHFWMDEGERGFESTRTIIGADLVECLRLYKEGREPDDGRLVRITRARICRRCRHAECPGCRVWCDQMVKMDHPTEFEDDYDFCPCIETNCDYGDAS